MPERIVNILARCRRRAVVVRAAEAAAMAAIVSAPASAALMASRILLARHPASAAVACALPTAAGLVLAAWPAARKALGPGRRMQRGLTALLLALGGAAAVALSAGAWAAVPKDMLALIVPACALAAAAAAVIRPTPMSDVARKLDRKAGLAERLATAWELREGPGDGPFIRALHDQAARAATDGRLAGVRFWTRTRATAGALGLALVAAASMLPWTPLESPASIRQRQWRQVAPDAGEAIAAEIEAALADAARSPAALASLLDHLETFAKGLQAADPDDADRWEGKVAEMADIAGALRQLLRDRDVDPAARQRLQRLLNVLDQAGTDIAAAMGGNDAGTARPVDPDMVRLPAPHDRSPAGWATVYDPLYEKLVTTTSPAAPDGADSDAAPALHQAPYDRQWMQARARAARAIESREVPWEYRALVEGFFATRP